jgi:hypothetical protein
MGGSSNEIGYSIAVDKIGNVYTTGYFIGTTDFDPGVGIYNLTSSGNFDIFISKLDAFGNFIWAKSMGGVDMDVAYSICIDDSGNVLTTGQFWDTADFDPGIGTFLLTAPGSFGGCFISKLDSSGNFVWARNFVGYYSWGLSITADEHGNVFTIGEFGNTVDFDSGNGTFNMTSTGNDVFISKLNHDGNFVWAKRMGGNAVNHGTSIYIDISGNIYTTGLFDGPTDFDPGVGIYNLNSSGGYDIFIAKLDSSGNFIWAKRIGGSGSDQSFSIAVDSIGSVYTTGGFEVLTDFDPGVGIYNLTSSGNFDIFISKLDSSGNFVWARKIGSNGSDVGEEIRLDKGSVYLTGVFQGTVDFDPNGGTSDLISSGGDDIFVLKLDSSGKFDWAKKMGGSGQDVGFGIVIDKSRNVYGTGRYQLTGDFDPGISTYNLTSQGGYDIYVLKLCSSSDSAGPISGAISSCQGSTKIYSINPVLGATGFFWAAPSDATINSGQNTTSITVTFGTNSGNITVTPYNSCSNGEKVILIVTINPLPIVGVTVTPSATVCTGTPITLNGTGAKTYAWSGGVINGTSFIPTTSGTYHVIGTDSNGCTGVDSILINVTPFPEKIKQRKYVICPLKTVTISAENNLMKYLWDSGDTTQQINTAKAGIHQVKISNGICIIYDSIEVLNFTVSKPTISIQNNQLISSKANTYRWYSSDTLLPNVSKQHFAPKHNGYYTVSITDSNSCEAISDSVYFERIFSEIRIFPNPSLNVFTIELPNQSNNEYTFELYDAIGRRLQLNYSIIDGISKLDLRDYASASYFLKISDSFGNNLVKKIVKN